MTIYVGGKALATGGHTQNTDTGTDSSTFQLDNDSSGVKIKNNAGVLEVKNAADDAYANIKGLTSNVGNIQTSGNTISSTNTNGNILVTPNGTGTTNITNLNGYITLRTLTMTDDITLDKDSAELQILNHNGSTRIVNIDTTNMPVGKIFRIYPCGTYTSGYNYSIRENGTIIETISPMSSVKNYIFNGTNIISLDGFSSGGDSNIYDVGISIGKNSYAPSYYSVSIGRSSTTSNNNNSYGTAIGAASRAIGYGTALGYNSDAIGSTSGGNISIGSQTTAGTSSSSGNVVIGGASTGNATTSKSTKAATTGAYNDVILLGRDTYSSATSTIAIGKSNKVTKSGQIALGAEYTYPTRYGEQKTNSGVDSTGKYSRSTLSWYKSTTDATPVEIFLDNSSERATVQASSVMVFSIIVAARDNVAGHGAGYKFEGVIKRDASNNTAIVGSVTKTVLAEDDATWDCDVTADDTNDGLIITVTGDDTNPTQWNAVAQISETHF